MARFEVFFLMGLAIASTTRCAELPIEADDKTQQLIKMWVETTDRDKLPEHFGLLAKLEPIAREDYERFSRQVMLYVYHHLDESALSAYQLFVFWSVPRNKVASGLSPYLYSSDLKLRRLVRELFPFTFFDSSKGMLDYPDYSHFRALPWHDRDMSESSLSRMMFEYAPSSAFLHFHKELGAAERFVARRRERIVANALYEKVELGGLPDGNIDVIKRLLEDENKLVRQSVASIEKPDPLRFAEVDR